MSGTFEKLQGMELRFGKMEELMLESGYMTTELAMELTPALMEELTLENGKTTQSMECESRAMQSMTHLEGTIIRVN